MANNETIPEREEALVSQAEADVLLLRQMVHGGENTVIITDGGPVPSLLKWQKDASSFFEDAASRTESARDATYLNAGLKDSVEQGLATTTSGQLFTTHSPLSNAFLDVYKNNAGVEEYIDSYPNAEAIKNMQAVVDTETDLAALAEGPFILADADGKKAIEVTPEGKTNLGLTKDVGGKAALVPGLVVEVDKLKSFLFESEEYAQSGYLLSVLDALNRIGVGIDKSGDLVVRGQSVHKRLTALESSPAIDPGIEKWINGLSSLACWGDSLTFGAGASNDSYPKALATLLGRAVHRGAVGGQNSQQIATRQGGYINLLTVTGNTIPASGAVNITASTQAPITSQGGGPIVGTLAGVAGSVSATFDGSGNRTAYLFTRTTAGTALIIDAATPFIPVEDDHQFEVSVFWYGRNNFWTGRTDFDNAKAEVKAALAASIAFLKPLNKKFVVMSVLNDNKEAEWVGTEKYNAIKSLNEELKALYPRNFIDIRQHLVRAYNPALPQDVIDFGHDVTPTSLLSDTLHLNVAGYALVALIVYYFIIQKGW